MKKIVYTENAPNAIGPYSQATEINGMVFTSGQIGINPEDGSLELSDLSEETHQVMKNLKVVLNAAGTDFNEVVKTGIFLKNMDHFATVNEIYSSYFEEASGYPARETVQVARLPKDVNVEISMIAVKA